MPALDPETRERWRDMVVVDREAATVGDGEVRLPYTKAHVRRAPQVEPGVELSADDELLLHGHYGLLDRHGAVAERPPAGTRPGPVPAPASRSGPPARRSCPPRPAWS